MNTIAIKITRTPEENGYYKDDKNNLYELLNVRVNHKRVFRKCSISNRLYLAVSDTHTSKNITIEPDYNIELDVFGRIYLVGMTSGAHRYGDRFFEYVVDHDTDLYTIIEYNEYGDKIAIWYCTPLEEVRSILGKYPMF